jgi:hypothetical protein
MSTRLLRLCTISREGGMCMKMMGEVVCRGLEGISMGGGWTDEVFEGLKVCRWMGKWMDRWHWVQKSTKEEGVARVFAYVIN